MRRVYTVRAPSSNGVRHYNWPLATYDRCTVLFWFYLTFFGENYAIIYDRNEEIYDHTNLTSTSGAVIVCARARARVDDWERKLKTYNINNEIFRGGTFPKIGSVSPSARLSVCLSISLCPDSSLLD